MFAKIILRFKSDVMFTARGGAEEYNGKSMVSILSAAVNCGDEIELRVNGEDEQECVDAIAAAVESGLGEI
jgi:phosphotransferase system HPr (HPr) family protein